jgi:hypothetical protein
MPKMIAAVPSCSIPPSPAALSTATPMVSIGAILSLGERMARREISVEAHNALVNGLRAYLGDKAAEQQKKLDELEDALRGSEERP